MACFFAAVAEAPTLPAQANGATAAPTLAFEGVTVIDVLDGKRLPEQTVVIAGRRIQAVGSARKVRVPRDAQIVDAHGKYLIPGLWDMHVHLQVLGDGRETLLLADRLFPMYIASGVTGIRDMAQRFPHGADSFRVWQRDIAAGLRAGPRSVGPSADLTYGMKVDTPEEIRHVFDSLKAAGDAFVKFHADGIDRDRYFTMAREARRVGLPMVGHASVNVADIELADSGQRSIEHANEMRCWMKRQKGSEAAIPDNLDSDTAAVRRRCAPVAAAFVRDSTWFTPTLYMFESYAPQVGMMYRLGVPFLAGTDGFWPMIRDSAWAPLHKELALLAEAGLTPLEVLQTATLNPAKFFHATDSLGTIAPGKLADLVLLDADPLADIHNTTKIRAVVANGRYFDRAALDALDPEGAKLAAGASAEPSRSSK